MHAGRYSTPRLAGGVTNIQQQDGVCARRRRREIIQRRRRRRGGVWCYTCAREIVVVQWEENHQWVGVVVKCSSRIQLFYNQRAAACHLTRGRRGASHRIASPSSVFASLSCNCWDVRASSVPPVPPVPAYAAAGQLRARVLLVRLQRDRAAHRAGVDRAELVQEEGEEERLRGDVEHADARRARGQVRCARGRAGERGGQGVGEQGAGEEGRGGAVARPEGVACSVRGVRAAREEDVADVCEGGAAERGERRGVGAGVVGRERAEDERDGREEGDEDVGEREARDEEDGEEEEREVDDPLDVPHVLGIAYA